MEAQILNAWDAGRRPRLTGKDRWVLPTGGRRHAVLAQNGNITPAGHHLWENRGWTYSASDIDMNTPPRLRGTTEYLRTHAGNWVEGRRFTRGSWQLTARGRRT